MKIGYVGLGSMGGALARRLLLAHPLHVHDVNATAAQRMSNLGAKPCASGSELAVECDTILLCLPTSAEVRTAIFGPTGLAATARQGTLIVDQTTGDPTATRAMAAELAPDGIDLIDAPVSGGPRGADAGTIAIMVGATGSNTHASCQCCTPSARTFSTPAASAPGRWSSSPTI